MTHVYQPRFVRQLDGSSLGGLNCTCASAAMAIDRASLGAKRPTGEQVRALCRNTDGSRDVTGGTRLSQNADAALRGWGVELDVEQGISITELERRVESGMAALVQGSSSATRYTPWSASETFAGNHCWELNAIEGDNWIVNDPLADGRRTGIARSPLRLPRAIGHRFAGWLNVSADPERNYVALGVGRVWAAFTRDTEPRLVLRYGSVALDPAWHMVTRAAAGQSVNVRKGPGRRFVITTTLAAGRDFRAHQRVSAELIGGSRSWFGNQTGDRWVHGLGLYRED